MHERSPGRSALITARQIGLFCIPQLTDAGCLEADHNAASCVTRLENGACGARDLKDAAGPALDAVE